MSKKANMGGNVGSEKNKPENHVLIDMLAESVDIDPALRVVVEVAEYGGFVSSKPDMTPLVRPERWEWSPKQGLSRLQGGQQKFLMVVLSVCHEIKKLQLRVHACCSPLFKSDKRTASRVASLFSVLLERVGWAILLLAKPSTSIARPQDVKRPASLRAFLYLAHQFG